MESATGINIYSISNVRLYFPSAKLNGPPLKGVVSHGQESDQAAQ